MKLISAQSFKVKIAMLFVATFVVGTMFSVVMPWLMSVNAASPPNIVSYQGRVLNANSVPVANASLNMEFRLFTAASGGTCVWSNSSVDCDANTPASTVARSVT
ncbi:MAG: hypothetical protein ABH846_04105, partial [Patescibacteria group bacterium]